MTLRNLLSPAGLGLAVLLSALPSAALTELSGAIGDTTLRLSGSPYLVTGDITITTGTTWTVEAGVIVKFNDNRQITGSQVTFRVNGTAAAPVIFTSSRDDSAGQSDDNQDGRLSYPAPGNWRGLSLTGLSRVSIRHAAFRYGGNDNSGFHATLHLQNAETSVIDSSSVYFSGSQGIRVELCASKVTLSDLEIYGTVHNGLYLHGDGTGKDSTLVRRTEIHGGLQWAVYIGSGSGDLSSPNLGDTSVPGSGLNRFHDNALGAVRTNVSTLVNIACQNDFWSASAVSEQNITAISASITHERAPALVRIKPTADPDTRPPAAPGAFTVLPGVSSGLLHLSFTAPQEDTGAAPSGNPVAAYQVRYDTLPIVNFDSARYTVTAPPYPAAPGASQTFVLNSLVAGKTYYAAIRAVDDYGNTGAFVSGSALSGGGAGTVVTWHILRDTVWTLAGSPYRLNIYNFYVDTGARLTIDSGVIVQLTSYRLDVRGRLTVRGTPTAPVVFTTRYPTDAPGSNDGIYFNTQARACTLSHCVVEKSGGAIAAVHVAGTGRDFLFEHLRIENGTQVGLMLDTATGVTVNDCAISNMGSSAIAMAMGAQINFSGIRANNCFNNGYFINTNGSDSTLNRGRIRWMDSTLYYVLSDADHKVGKNDTLEIGPGVTVKFKRVWSQFDLLVNGVLLSRGTASKPTRWTAATHYPAPSNGNSHWGYIQINNLTNSSVFRNNLFEYSGTNGYGALYCTDASPIIDSCRFRNILGTAVYLQGNSRPSITNSTFSRCATPIFVGNGSGKQSDPFVSGNAAEDNANNGIVIQRDYNLLTSVWEADRIPYLILNGSLSVSENLTLNEGTQVLFQNNPNYELIILSGGRLTALGTAAEPVVLTADGGVAGSWAGIRFNAGSHYDSRLSHTRILNAGGISSEAAVVVNGCEPAFDSVLVDNSKTDGISVYGTVSTPAKVRIVGSTLARCVNGIALTSAYSTDSLIGNVFADHIGSAIRFPAANTPYMTGNRDSSAVKSVITLTAGQDDATATLKMKGRSFTLDTAFNWAASLGYYDFLQVGSGDTLVMTAGSNLKITGQPYYAELRVRGTMLAQGTAQKPVTVTAADTLGQGSWVGIGFYDTLGRTSVLDYLTVTKAGGKTGQGAIHVDGARATLRNSLIRGCNEAGLTVRGIPARNARTVVSGTCFDSVAGGIFIKNRFSSDSLIGNTFKACSTFLISHPVANIPAMAPYVPGMVKNLDSSNGLPMRIVANQSDSARLGRDTVTLDSSFKWEILVQNYWEKILVDTHQVLNILPGTNIAFRSLGNSYTGCFDVVGRLSAVGTAADSIRFRSADSVRWGGLIFERRAVGDSSRMAYCRIENAGDFYYSNLYGMVRINTGRLALTRTLFSNPLMMGILAGDSVYPRLDSLYFDSTFNYTKLAAALNIGSTTDTLPLNIPNTYWGDPTGPRDTVADGGLSSLNPASKYFDADGLDIANFGLGGWAGRHVNYVPFVGVDLSGPLVDSIVSTGKVGAAKTVTVQAFLSDRYTGNSAIDSCFYRLSRPPLTATDGNDFDWSAVLAAGATAKKYTVVINTSDLGMILGDTLRLWVRGRDSKGNWGEMDSAWFRLTGAKDTTPPTLSMLALDNPAQFTDTNVRVILSIDDTAGHTRDQGSKIYDFSVNVYYWQMGADASALSWSPAFFYDSTLRYNRNYSFSYSYLPGGGTYLRNSAPAVSMTFKLPTDTLRYNSAGALTYIWTRKDGFYRYLVTVTARDSANQYGYTSPSITDSFYILIGDSASTTVGGSDSTGPGLIKARIPPVTLGVESLYVELIYGTFQNPVPQPVGKVYFFTDRARILPGTGSQLTLKKASDALHTYTFAGKIPLPKTWIEGRAYSLYFIAEDNERHTGPLDSFSVLYLNTVASNDSTSQPKITDTAAIDTVPIGVSGVEVVLTDSSFINDEGARIDSLKINVIALETNQQTVFRFDTVSLKPVGTTYNFESSSADGFSYGMIIRLPYTPADLRGASPGKLLIYTSSNGLNWDLASNERPDVDTVNRKVYVTVKHFSWYRLALDLIPPTINNASFRLSGGALAYLNGSSALPSLSVRIADNAGFGVKPEVFFLQRSGDGTGEAVTLITSGLQISGDTLTWSTSSSTNETGMEYQFAVSDLVGNRDTSDFFSIPVKYPEVTANIPAFTAKKYSIFSVPYTLDNAQVLDVFKNIGLLSAGNEYDSTRMRLFGYDGKKGSTAAGFYTELSAGQLARKKGYLLITDKNVGAGQTATLTFRNAVVPRLDSVQRIPLTAGWNLVGNPYPFALPLKNLRLASANGLGTAHTWYKLKSDETFDTIKAGDTLPSYSGYFVHYHPADTAERDTILLNKNVAYRSAKAAETADSLAQFDWTLNLTAAGSSGTPSRLALGARSGASKEFDPYDRAQVPPLRNLFSIQSPRRAWKSPALILGGDFVAHTKEGHVWEIEVQSLSNEPAARITWEKPAGLPEGFSAYLVDAVRNNRVDLSVDSAYEAAVPAGDRVALRVAAGTPDFIKNWAPDPGPLEFALGENRPNPFNPATRIHFSLRENARVSLGVYDLRGRLVKTLIQDQKMLYGRYSATWQGNDDHGRAVATGLYFYRISTPKFVKIRKMMMVK